MLGRSFNLYLVVALLLALQAGCKKSEPEKKSESLRAQSQNYTNSASGELIARIHWLGKKRIAADPNAAAFITIWNLPESQKLENQTLDKLALAPWDLPRSGTNLAATIATNTASALLRPLLDDLLQEESYLEIRGSPARAASAGVEGKDKPASAGADSGPERGTTGRSATGATIVLAIHLDEPRAALWETNLAALIESLGGKPPTAIRGARGWNSVIENQKSKIENTLSVSRAGQWTLLGFGDNQNDLLRDVTARIQHNNAPFSSTPTNYWIDAQLDLKRVTPIFLSAATSADSTANTNVGAVSAADANVGVTWPTNFTLTIIGDGRNVLTRGEFDFPQPLPIELEPWNIPTNLIHDPLIGFSAIRGFRPLLKTFKPWNDLPLGTPPNQAYTWAQHGAPWLHFAAFPSPDASNQVDRLADFVVRDVNPKLTGRIGTFEKLPGTQQLKWKGVPVFSPDLNWTNIDGNSFILAGFFSRPITNLPPPPELFIQFNSSTNMLWYDWEFSKECLEGLTPINQVVRHMFNLPRFSPDPDIAWLVNVAARLGNSVSALKLESPTHLSFSRQSTFGFTAPELPFLLDWLESPKFPRGLQTFLAPPPEPPTNSVPQPNTNSVGEQKKL
jgi:hypothetical protein